MLARTAPDPAKEPAVTSKDALLRKPGMIAVLSTFGLCHAIELLYCRYAVTDLRIFSLTC